jgi:hypothetical protein
MRILTLWPLLLLSFSINAQTCVLVKITRDGIYAGAESRVFTLRNNPRTGQKDTIFSSACKLHHVGNFNFAIIGHFPYLSMQKAINACKTNSNLTDMTNQYINDFAKGAADSLMFYQKYEKEEFDSIRTALINEILFFGFENHQSYIISIAFTIESYSQIGVNIAWDYQRADQKDYPMALAGDYDYIRKYISTDSIWNKNPAKEIKRLIEIESKAEPLKVGGQVDVLFVNEKKIKWIYKKPECSNED